MLLSKCRHHSATGRGLSAGRVANALHLALAQAGSASTACERHLFLFVDNNMLPTDHRSPNSPSVASGQDARKIRPEATSDSKTTVEPPGNMADHPLYHQRGPSNLQRRAATQVRGESSSPISSSPVSKTTPFRTMMSLAESVVEALGRLTPEERTIENAKKYAKSLSTYFPHRLEDFDRLINENKPQNRSNFLKLVNLAEEYGDSIQFFSQTRYQKSGGKYFSPRELFNELQSLEADKISDAEKAIYNDFYIIAPNGLAPLEDADFIDARLSINVKPEYAHLLAEIFTYWSEEDTADVYQSKMSGPGLWGVRPETGIVMLEKADFGNAVILSRLIHEGLIRKLGRDVSPAELYGTPPAFAQETYPDIAPGIAYIEKIPGASEDEGAGQRRYEAVALAAHDCVVLHKDLTTAMKLRSIEAGISTINGAFALRSGEDPQAVQERVDAALKRAQLESEGSRA